jgi:hypothetical protein
MAADPLARMLARVEAMLAALFRRLTIALSAAITDTAGADDPLPAAAVPALSRLIDREIGRIAGRDSTAVIDRDGRPLVPLAVLLVAAQGAGAGLTGAPAVAPPARAILARRVAAAGDEARRQLRARVAWHVAQGTPVSEAAADVVGLLRPSTRVEAGRPGGTDATYAARRLIANETRAAHATATVGAARASGGRYLVRYTPSAAHVDEDDCTRYSRTNNGWGPGVFDPTRPLPPLPAHPNCRCRWDIVRGDRA